MTPAACSDHVEKLRADWEAKKAAHEKLRAEAAAASDAEHRAELALLIAEDRGRTPHAEWIRAWLRGDHAGCDYWLAKQYPVASRRDAERALDTVSAVEKEAARVAP